MSKLFDEWVKHHRLKDYPSMGLMKLSWNACKAEAIRLLKAEIHVPIEKKGRSFENILEDL